MSRIILGFPDSGSAAQRLAAALSDPCAQVAVHRFPDREVLITVPEAAECVILYRSLHDPDAKLIELILAASAARDLGARQVILVAPYLAYMRQDIAFHRGEAVSQRVIGALIAQHFDGLITIDPHLHRTARLDQITPGIEAVTLSAAPLLATLLDTEEHPVIVGPDSEAAQWTRSIADPGGYDVLGGRKLRHGDRDVELKIDRIESVRGRVAVLVDDVIASGATLIEAGRQLLAAGAIRVDAIATHCLASADDLLQLKAEGISNISSTDSVETPTARAHVAPLLADALQKLSDR